MFALLLVSSLFACTQEAILRTCVPHDPEPPIAPEQTSSLGFSADEVLATLERSFELPVKAVHGTADSTRTLSFSFEPEGDAWVEVVDDEGEMVTAAGSYEDCIVGSRLTIPITLTVSSADGWFVATGPATIVAQGTTEDRIWLDAALEVEPSTELKTEALAANRDACTDADLSVWYGNTIASWNPWSVGPVGGLEFRTCNGSGVLYGWGELAP